jgi:hypothetical protein
MPNGEIGSPPIVGALSWMVWSVCSSALVSVKAVAGSSPAFFRTSLRY